MNYSKIIDISVGLDAATVVYPGTPLFSAEPSRSTATGSRLTKLTMSTHFGTHLDAPLHVLEDGTPVDRLPLTDFVGQCRVVDCSHSMENISLADVKKIQARKGERLLFKTTNSERGLGTYFPDFIYMSPEAAHYLADTQISLAGIDYYSIKQKGSADNIPHTAFLSKNIPILEGIDLKAVEPGDYFLVALPLKFIGLDGSPCRAVLLQ